MADWRRLSRAALLDGQIDEKKVAVLRKEFFADKRIERAELEFLLDVRKNARGAAPEFEKMVFEAVRTYILGDGKVTPDDTAWLRTWIQADGKVNDAEKKLLKELRLLADQTCPEFQALYKEFVG